MPNEFDMRELILDLRGKLPHIAMVWIDLGVREDEIVHLSEKLLLVGHVDLFQW